LGGDVTARVSIESGCRDQPLLGFTPGGFIRSMASQQSQRDRIARRVRTTAAFALGSAAALLVAMSHPVRAFAHFQAPASSVSVTVTIKGSAVTVSPTAVPAGAVAFKIFNRTKIARNFEIAGRTTPVIPAGKSANLTVRLRKEGPLALRSGTRSRAPWLTGELDVYEPCTNPVATTVRMQMAQDNGGITVSQATIACGAVTFVVTNAGSVTDSLQIFTQVPSLGVSTPELLAGQTATLTIHFVEKGVVYYQSGDFPPAEPELSGNVHEEGHFILD
jgi:hypothetical protein